MKKGLFLVAGLFWASALSAFPFWLDSPSRENPADKKSWSHPGVAPIPTSLPTPAPPPLDYHLVLRDFTPIHSGQTLGLRVRDLDDGVDVAHYEFTQAAYPCNTSVYFPKVVPNGHSLWSGLVAEYGPMAGVYDPSDHSYQLTITAASLNVHTSLSHSSAQVPFGEFTFGQQLPPASAGYKLVVALSNFSPHVNQSLILRVRDSASMEIAALLRVPALPSDCHEIHCVAVLQAGRDYQVDLAADFNSNSSIDPIYTDHSWRLSTGTVAGDVVLNLDHNTATQQSVDPMPFPPLFP